MNLPLYHFASDDFCLKSRSHYLEVKERILKDIIMNAVQINYASTVVTFMMDYYMKTILGIALPLIKGKTRWSVLLEVYVHSFWES